MNTKVFLKFTEDAILHMARVNGDVGRETLLYVVKIVRRHSIVMNQKDA